jgi:hypothetical protein
LICILFLFLCQTVSSHFHLLRLGARVRLCIQNPALQLQINDKFCGGALIVNAET